MKSMVNDKSIQNVIFRFWSNMSTKYPAKTKFYPPVLPLETKTFLRPHSGSGGDKFFMEDLGVESFLWPCSWEGELFYGRTCGGGEKLFMNILGGG